MYNAKKKILEVCILEQNNQRYNTQTPDDNDFFLFLKVIVHTDGRNEQKKPDEFQLNINLQRKSKNNSHKQDLQHIRI